MILMLNFTETLNHGQILGYFQRLINSVSLLKMRDAKE